MAKGIDSEDDLRALLNAVFRFADQQIAQPHPLMRTIYQAVGANIDSQVPELLAYLKRLGVV